MSLTALALLLLGPQGQPQIAVMPIGDRQVPVILPKDEPEAMEPGQFVEAGGLRYEVVKGAPLGTPIPRLPSTSWTAFGPRFAASHAKAGQGRVWRTKVFVAMRSDILDDAANGVLTTRRAGLEDEDVDRIYRSLGLFSALVEAASGGALRAQVSVDVETLPIAATAGKNLLSSFLRSWEPLINGAGFVPDDNRFRGPYDSVFVVHPGLAYVDHTTLVADNPTTAITYFRFVDQGRDQALANAFYAGWLRHLRLSLRSTGYVAPLAASPVAQARDFGCPLGEGPPLSAQEWKAVLEGDAASAFAGGIPSLNQPVADRWVGLPTPRQDDVTLVDASLAPLVLAFQPQLKPIGWMPHTGALAAKGALGDWRFPSPTAPMPVDARQSFEPGVAESLPRGGLMEAKSVQDPERGSVGEFSIVGVARNGWVRLLGKPGASLGPTDGKRHLQFWIKATKPQPMALTFHSGAGGGQQSLYLFGDLRVPREHGGETAAPKSPAVMIEEGSWTHVAVEVPLAGPIAAIDFETHTLAPFWEPITAPAQVFLLDDVEVTSTPTATVRPAAHAPDAEPRSDSARADERVLWVVQQGGTQQAALTTLLDDPTDWVRLNAAYVLTRHKVPTAEAQLAALARGLNFRIAEAAIQALAFQDTESTRAALRSLATAAPFDANKGAAALAYAPFAEPRFAGTLSVLASSRNWMTRAAAAHALGSMSGQEPAIVRLSFLQDVHPAVRVAAASRADCSQSLVAQRLMWTAVNDTSDSVRLAAYLSLSSAQDPNVRKEGFKGIRDDSSWVRHRFCQYLQHLETPPAETLPALLAATVDADPLVVASALEAVRAQAQKLNPKATDFAHAVKNTHPAVQRAYLELAHQLGWPLSADDKQVFGASADPVVVAMAGF